MAKKVTIKDYENTRNKTKKEKNKLLLTIQILLIIFGISLIGNVLLIKLLFDYKEKTVTAKDDYVTTIVSTDKNGEVKLERLNPPLNKDVKMNFFDENIVFVLDNDNYYNYYYTYDCLIKRVGDNDFSYWAYNKSAAKAKGYIEKSC